MNNRITTGAHRMIPSITPPSDTATKSGGSTSVPCRCVDGKIVLLDNEPKHVTNNRVSIDSNGSPTAISYVNFGEDDERMTAVLRSRWPNARAVFVRSVGSWQGSDISYFDVVLNAE